jgi:hypothetical protein
MTSSDLAALREIFLSAPIPLSTRIMALWISFSLLVVVLWLVKRRLLREQYTPIWVVAAAGVMILNVWPTPLFAMTRALGAWTHGSTLFYLGLLFVVALCLSYAVRLSALTLQVKNLAQEISLLRAQLEGDREAASEPSRVQSPT